jgi:diguanylate cyclase (GGDEF)-like protein
MRAITTGETTTNYEARFRRADGSPLDVACTVAPNLEAGEPVGAVLVFRDISEHKRLAELTHQAFHDSLTGLPNRRQFLSDLTNALERSRQDGARHAVLFADIDRFKVINDSLGHSAGDLFLISVAEKLREALRPGDKLARLGGDEFTVLLEDIGSAEDAAAVAQRVLRTMREPIELRDGHKVAARLSIGIALTSPAKTCDDVLHDADVAMYEAKARGRSGEYCVFEPVMGVRSAERVELEMELRQAIEHNDLEVYYQPLFSTFDRRVVSVEALVRWQHPLRGLLAPASFIDIAEETGLIFALGRTVLEQACQKVQEWKDLLGVEVTVAVNLSARQFQDPGLLAGIGEVLRSTGADAARLCFEVTESLAVDDVERTNQVLSSLRELGASVAIDDFGTGHSALGHLARFPTDVVKIDRAFIDGVETDQVKSAIVSAVLAMAKAIGCTTVVEGVETESQLCHLRGLGCSVAQGYLFARPMPASNFEELFRAANGRRLGRVPGEGRLNAARAPSAVRRLPDLAAVDDASHFPATAGIA